MLVGGSFKDPIGQVEQFDSHVERTCAPHFTAQVKELLRSEAFRSLVEQRKVLSASWDETTSRIHQPLIPYWTYPFEWSFSMLQDAALLTLDIQQQLLLSNYSLKDSSAYNVVFLNGRPIFTDLYSIEPFVSRISWSGYDQFCREFLNPLLLQDILEVPFQPYFRGSLNGIPSSHASKLFPKWQVFRRGCFNHVFLKSWMEAKNTGSHSHSNSSVDAHAKGLDPTVTLALQKKVARSLTSKIETIGKHKRQSHWLSYRTTRTYADSEIQLKKNVVSEFCKQNNASALIDYGCNDGEFSELASSTFSTVVATDIDEACIDAIYNRQKAGAFPSNVVLVVQDLSNPSLRLGWNGEERFSFHERMTAGAFLALALVHHLRISHNIPTQYFLDYWKRNHQAGVIEYVGLDDPMVRHLLSNRKGFDISDYKRDAFVEAVNKTFCVNSIERLSPTRELIVVSS